MSDSEKFPLGCDAAVYIDEAVKELQARYHWVTCAHLDPSYTYEIKKVKGKYEYIKVYRPDGKRQGEESVMDCETAEDFIREIVRNNDYYILGNNKTIATYKVPYFPVDTGGGWWLEHYDFQKLATGDYSVFVQAGDRFNGGSRTFFIPPELREGKTWEEFLDGYAELVPGDAFGLYKKDLIHDGALRAFLGFTAFRPHPEVQFLDLPAKTVYGICRLIRMDDPAQPLKSNSLGGETDRVLNMRTTVRRRFSSVFPDVNIADAPFWGIMSNERPENGLCPWTHNYKTGFYMAGYEVALTLPLPSIPDDPFWEKWEIPAARYIVHRVDPAAYEQDFYRLINTVIPEMGLTLSGPVCDYHDPKTGEDLLLFAVTERP